MKSPLFAVFIVSVLHPVENSAAPSGLLPEEVRAYYEDCNQLAILERQPVGPAVAGTSRFTLEPVPPEVAAMADLRGRIQRRELSTNARFLAPGSRVIHSRDTLFRTSEFFRRGDEMMVACEVYAPPGPSVRFASFGLIDFAGLELLYRETHTWRYSGGQWFFLRSVRLLGD